MFDEGWLKTDGSLLLLFVILFHSSVAVFVNSHAEFYAKRGLVELRTVAGDKCDGKAKKQDQAFPMK